jgi:hypothetical protein
MSTEDQYKKQLKDAGVDIPGVTDEEEEGDEPKNDDGTTDTDSKADDTEDDSSKKDDDSDDSDGKVDEPHTPEKKRSIYDDLKDKKKEVKTERERAEFAERERDELKTKLEALTTADQDDKQDAKDDLDKFLESHKEWDKEAINDLITLARTGEQKIDESLLKDIQDFKAWKTGQDKSTEAQRFDSEFNSTVPALKSYFPNATDAEIAAMKPELDKIAHSDGWNDKSLDYIAYKHKPRLEKLLTPKKKGTEERGSVAVTEETETEFNSAPDFTKMSASEIAAWEKQYKNAGTTEGLVKSGGRKMII